MRFFDLSDSKIYSVNLKRKRMTLVPYGKESVVYQMLLLRKNNRDVGMTHELAPQKVDNRELLWN